MKIDIRKHGIHGKGLTIGGDEKEVIVYSGDDVLKRDVDYIVEDEDNDNEIELHTPWLEFPIIFKKRRG